MRVALTAVLLFVFLIPLAGQGRAEVQVGVSADSDGLKAFHLAIGDHFRVDYRDVVSARERHIPDQELPVVYFIASRAGVAPGAVIKMRLGGKSWMQIAFHYGLDAGHFYIPVERKPGPPYGKAYGHFKNKKKKQWREINLTDVEIINFVNLRFVSEHYGYSPDEVMKMREKGENFVVINREVKKAREKKAQASVSPDDTSKSKKSKGKGKKKK